LLRSLEKFYDEQNTPTITELSKLYEEQYEQWRDQTVTRLTNKPLSPRSRNNESNCHRQFFGFLKDREIVSKVPEVNLIRVEQTNHLFPQKHYAKVLSVSRKEIAEVINPKTKWNWQCMRTLILLMSGTGCRVTEAHNLRWKDVFLDTKKSPRIYFHGKNKEREISISPRVYGYLEELKEFKQVWGIDWEFNIEDYEHVFSSWKMKPTPNQFDSAGRRRWYELAGINTKDYPLVCFRHKFISDALRNGTHALQIAFYTGTSVKMIQQTYGKITPPDLFEQVFASAPDESLRRKDTSKWFNDLLTQKTSKS
jgi:integrase